MSIINQQFENLGAVRKSGLMALPLAKTYFPRLLHATFRNFTEPVTETRITHFHDIYHLVLVTGGRGHFVVGDKLQPTEPGLLFITSPGEPHAFMNVGEETTEYCEVTFEFTDTQGKPLTLPFHEALGTWAGCRCQPISVAAVSTELHVTLMEEIENMVRDGVSRKDHLDLLLNASLTRIFLALFAQLYQSVPVTKENDSMQHVREYIHHHYSRPLTLPQLARLARVSPNYLSRKFKQRFGMTPINYQQKLRIQTAANLLRATTHEIKEIAEVTGFSDVYFFSKIFKKTQGIPPGAYRKEARSM